MGETLFRKSVFNVKPETLALERIGESELRSRVPCPPAPPKAPPRCHSRSVSWARRHNLEDEPQAQWSAQSGRYAAVCVCAATPTRDLSAQPPDRMTTVALARAMVRHCFRGIRTGYELLKGTHCGRVRPARLVAAWPSQRLRRHRKGHSAVRIRRPFGLFQS